jgi:hypothetical protein
MADSQHTERPAAVTPAKRDSYLRYVQIHLELLHDSLAGQDFGCGLGQWDREEIDRHLLEIWNIAWAAKLEVVDPRPAPDAPSGDGGRRMADGGRSSDGGKVIPFRPRLAG